MKTILFLNPQPPRCGVHQYGLRLFSILSESKRFQVAYRECDAHIGPMDDYDVIIYNLHPGIPNAMHGAPFHTRAKQVGIYHDGGRNQDLDQWWFSDPSGKSHGNLKCIGRPLPNWTYIPIPIAADRPITLGVSGLVGAWASTMVYCVLSQIPEARIRLHLAPSDHCDPTGALARSIGESCHALSPNVEVDYEFKEMRHMREWLEDNHMNCYIRTPAACSGISSALDLALAVHRPMAINSHFMFRHITSVSPEICIENNSLRDILALGCSPTIQHRIRNSRERVLEEMEEALDLLFA